MKTPPETQFALLLDDLKIKYERQHSFHQWFFDFAVPWYKIAFEIEGGVWTQGRHNRPIGFMNDCKKYFTAQMEGWQVIRIPSPWLYHTSRHKQQKYLLTYEEVKQRIKALFS